MNEDWHFIRDRLGKCIENGHDYFGPEIPKQIKRHDTGLIFWKITRECKVCGFKDTKTHIDKEKLIESVKGWGEFRKPRKPVEVVFSKHNFSDLTRRN